MKLTPYKKRPSGSVKLPSSKSEYNRLKMIQAYSDETITILNPSGASDSKLLDNLLSVINNSNSSSEPVLLDCGNAGTVLRFLLTYVSGLNGRWLLTGTPRMKQRPVGSLVSALKELGASITYTEKEGYPPVSIEGRNLKGGRVFIDTSQSSQFATSLMLAAPMLEHGLELTFVHKTSSFSYIHLTAGLMKHCGALTEFRENNIIIPPSKYKASTIAAGSDWSAAAFWYELIALSQSGELFLEGIDTKSLQGDKITSSVFEQLGVETHPQSNGILIKGTGKHCKYLAFDFTHYPDMYPAIAATCAGLGIKTKFTGTSNLNIKESDRVKAMKTELAKLGLCLETDETESNTRTFGDQIDEAGMKVLNSWDDHRIAMSLAPLVLVSGPFRMTGAEAVNKSYPGFWDQLVSTKCIGITEENEEL